MKKTLVSTMTAVMLMTACNKTEEIATNAGNAINFTGMKVENMTRATDLNSVTLKNISVFGTMMKPNSTSAPTYIGIFKDQEVVKQGEAGQENWTYEPVQYWIQGNTYWFTAIAPYGGDNDIRHWSFTPDEEPVPSESTKGELEFDNEAAGADQDLLLGVTGPISPDQSDPGPVKFTLKHLLSRVKFTFINGFSSAYKIVVKEILLLDAASSATMKLPEGNWNVGTDVFNIPFTSDGGLQVSAVDGTPTQTPHRYLIPQQKVYQVTLKIDVLQGEETATSVETTVTLPEVDMMKGNSYNFIATLEPGTLPGIGNAIEFEVEAVEEWLDWQNVSNN